jgi:type IV secretory pathway VirB10-like protein
MSPYKLRLPASSSISTNFISARSRARQAIALLSALLLTAPGVAQQSSPNPPPNSRDFSTTTDTRSNATASVPAGTRLALVLTQPIQTRYFRRGDDVYAQVVSPVASGKEVIIPAGTFVQGKFDKMERHGGRAELRLASLAITFPDGYVAPVTGPITLESDDG